MAYSINVEVADAEVADAEVADAAVADAAVADAATAGATVADGAATDESVLDAATIDAAEAGRGLRIINVHLDFNFAVVLGLAERNEAYPEISDGMEVNRKGATPMGLLGVGG